MVLWFIECSVESIPIAPVEVKPEDAQQQEEQSATTEEQPPQEPSGPSSEEQPAQEEVPPPVQAEETEQMETTAGTITDRVSDRVRQADSDRVSSDYCRKPGYSD